MRTWKEEVDGVTKSFAEVDVTKGKGTVTFCVSDLPLEVFAHVVALGLKELTNKGMSKVPTKGLEGADAEKAKADAMAIAEKNAENIRSGNIKIAGAKTTKVSGTLRTEAMRIARNIIKDQIKAAGGKVSHYDASEITAAAKDALETDPSILEQAKENLEKRAAVTAGEGKSKLAEIVSAMKTSPKKIKAIAEEKEAKKTQLSATQAGKPAIRPTPKGPGVAAIQAAANKGKGQQPQVRH